MDPGSETPGAPGEYTGLHFIDGTSSQLSYAVEARRGHIFLGVRFLGLADGDQFGGAWQDLPPCTRSERP
jgi:hypothetical protein